MKHILFLLALGGVAWGGAGDAHAKTGDDLRKVEAQMVQQTQKQEALDAAAKEAAEGLGDLRQRMIAATKSVQQKESEQEALENKLDQLTQEIADKSKNAEEERRQLSQMVSVLIEVASRPPETLFFQDRKMADHMHRSILLRSALPRLREKAEIAARDLAALYDLRERLAEHKRLVSAARTNLEKQQKDLDQMIAVRQGFLARTEAQKADIARHLADLAEEASDLRQLMERVAPLRSKKPAPPGAVALKWPVVGTVKKAFGDKDADGVKSEGLTLAGPSGAAVVAPYPGKVVFVGPFRGYGKIMILQHDKDYHTFLAGFGRMDAEMGQEVDAGEPLGVLPVKTGSRPELYFEWRRGDRPADPMGGLGKK